MTEKVEQSSQPASVTSTDAIGKDFDHHSSKMAWSPHDVWSRLRNECPVAYSSTYGGFYVLSRYDDVKSAAVNSSLFTTAESSSIPKVPLPQLLPEDIDGPLHRQYRSLINPFLSPQMVAQREPWMRSLAQQMLSGLAKREEFDVASGYAFPFPRHVAMDFIGVPIEDEPRLSEWTELMVSPTGQESEVVRAGSEFVAYLMDFIATQRSEPRQDNVASAVMHAEVNGKRLTEEECLGFMLTLVIGGLHTTTFAIGAAILWLADHPEDQRRLRENPDLMITAVDEFLRYATPTPIPARMTTSDTEVRGCPIPKGSWVGLSFGSANFDPAVFERPDEVLLDRAPNHHLALGMGPHRCAGSHLAKMEIKVAIEELLSFFPEFRIVDHGKLVWVGGGTRGLFSIPLRVDSKAESVGIGDRAETPGLERS